MFDGKKSKYLKIAEMRQYETAIARGKQLKQVDRQIEALRQRIGKIETAIAAV